VPWKTADVVVVGMGNAAQAAAFCAHENGAKVLVLEKAPEAKKGGNSAFSAGAQFRHAHNGLADERVLLPNVPPTDFEVIDLPPYSKDDFYNDLMRVTNNRAVPELAELLVNESYSTVKWMAESGITWEILYPEHQTGSRLRWHHGQSFIHAHDGGYGLVQMWHAILRREGIEVLFDTPLMRLLANERGEVYGVLVQNDDGYQEIHCKSVVLGCGGFEASPAMRAQWLGPGWDLAKVRGTRYNTGDGIQAALDIGAQAVGHYSYAHAAPIDAAAGEVEGAFLDPSTRRHITHRYAWPWGIMVNGEARRFLDEGEDFSIYTYAKFGGVILHQPGGVAHQIFDAKVTPLVLTGAMYTGATPTTGDTIAELAEKLDLRPDALVATIDEFNAACPAEDGSDYITRDGRSTRGITPAKTNWARRIDTPPYTSFAAACGITFTYGGLKVNPRMQVIDKRDRTIKGLYGCGELTGGFFFHNYPGGAGLLRGALTGRVGGRSAATD